jgi:hypothetical protein
MYRRGSQNLYSRYDGQGAGVRGYFLVAFFFAALAEGFGADSGGFAGLAPLLGLPKMASYPCANFLVSAKPTRMMLTFKPPVVQDSGVGNEPSM